MYIRYLINQYDHSDTIRDGLMQGANMFHQNFLTGTKQIYKTIVNNEQVLDHTKITQDKVHGPFAFVMRQLHLTGFDEALITFDEETLALANYGIHHLGGYVVGDFTTLELPLWKCDEDTIIGDILSCVLVSALSGDLSLAMSYLRSAQLFMSINQSTPLSFIQANDLSVSKQVSLNRL